MTEWLKILVSDMALVSNTTYFSLDATRNEQKFFEIKGRKFFGAEMFWIW
jgi:hypothetical protein